MGKFKKLFNYYLSSYWNNSRTLSSMYSFLKIFFERNNKIDSTVSSFGNVFRNSKWSNLQVQNIKKSFIKQWLSSALIISITFLILFTYSDTTLNLSYLTFFYIKQTLNELITNCYYFIGCLLFQVYFQINNLFTSNQTSTQVNNLSLNSNPSPFKVSSKRTDLHTDNTSNVSSNLFFLQKTLHLLDTFRDTNLLSESTSSIKNNNHFQLSGSFMNTIQQSTVLNSINTKPFIVDSNSLSELDFVLSTKLNSSFTNSLTLPTTLQDLYTNESSVNNDPMISETLTYGLNNIAKQQRWLTRNFWSNQNFVKDSNRITEAKSFIQNPLLSNNLIDTNIWMSNKLSGSETENTSSIFNQLSANPTLLPVFNSFDTSRFFLNQRYTFLNQLPNQIITNSSNIQLTSTPIKSSTTNLKLTLLQSYFTRNLSFNTTVYSSNINNLNYNTIPNSYSQDNMSNTQVHNLFVATTFTDLLQQNDLQSLNTINASVNGSSKLYLNSNFVNTPSFKS